MSDQLILDNQFDSSVARTTSPALPLDQNPAAVYLASLGQGSRQTMRTALNTIGELLGVGAVRDADGRDMRCLVVPWASLRYQHTAAVRAALQERYAPATANKLLAALRRVLKEARRLGQISADDNDRAADIKSIRAQRLPRGRALADTEIAALLRACAEEDTPAGARDAALIALLRGTGMRRAEAVALDLALELGPALAALAAAHLRPYPQVRVVPVAFENWFMEREAFDLVLSAQACHWIDPAFGLARAAAVLKPEGALTLVWHLDRPEHTDFSQATRPLYERFLPADAQREQVDPLEQRAMRYHDALSQSEAFARRTTMRHPWQHQYTGPAFLKLLQTFSNHQTLPEPAKTQYFQGMAAALARFGNVVTRHDETLLLLAHKADVTHQSGDQRDEYPGQMQQRAGGCARRVWGVAIGR
jgi:SAM-dependent methyltransferase